MVPAGLFSNRRKVQALVWGVAIFLVEMFAIVVYRTLLSELTFYLAVALAASSSVLVSLAIYLTEPKISKLTYSVRVEVRDREVEDPIGRAIIQAALEEGRVVPSKLADELGVTVYKIVERLYDLDREGKIKIEGIEATP